MDPQIQKPPTSWPLIILFLIIIVGVSIVGITYYNYEKYSLLNQKLQELSAISDLKIRQITQWRFERLADGKFVGENIMLPANKSDYLGHQHKKESQWSSLQVMKSLTENSDYSSAVLLDKTGNPELAFPSGDTLIASDLRSLLPGVQRDKKVLLTDQLINTPVSFVHLNLIIPITDHNVSDTVVNGFLILRIDPGKVLYPLLKSWPTPSKSAESFLIKKVGDEVVYMSELRHIRNAGPEMRKSAFEENLPAAMAFRGIKGTIDGVDYRKVGVVASMKKVPGTSWYMVAKIDREEVFSVLKSQMKLVLSVLVLFIATVGLFFGFILWDQRVRFYREKYESELNRLALFKHFDYILKFANDIILLLDDNLNIVEANDRALEVLKYRREELIGMNLKNILADQTRLSISDQIAGINEEGSVTFETLQKRSDDTVFPVEISSRIVDIEGSKYYQTIGRDITERKFAEETLRESELRFRKIFEESPFPMVITGKDFGIIRANDSFCAMTEYNEEELKTLTLSDLTHPDDADDNPVNFLRLITEDIPVYHNEKRYIRKNGSEIIGSSTISLIRNNRDEVQYFIAMVEDVTEKRRFENELIAAKLRAEESDRLKTAFLHNVSHEIRTPMNAIIGFSSLLNESDITDADRQQYTAIISQSSNQLLSIINDIVDVANIESGQVKVHLAKTDLNIALKNLDEQFSYSEKQFNTSIMLTTGLPDEQAIVLTDKTKLIQILSNLINNSVKFTHEGNIEFGYNLKDNFLEFFVTDTGIGIPEESLGKIFDRFYQVDRTTSRQFGGTGLGLSICKAYVELLGGDISVESRPGSGTRFIFTIPYLPAE